MVVVAFWMSMLVMLLLDHRGFEFWVAIDDGRLGTELVGMGRGEWQVDRMSLRVHPVTFGEDVGLYPVSKS